MKPPRSRGGANGRGEAGSGARCDGGRAATLGERGRPQPPCPGPAEGAGCVCGGKWQKAGNWALGEVISSSGLAGFVVVITEID